MTIQITDLIETSVDEIMDLISDQAGCIYLVLHPEDEDDVDGVRIKEIEKKLTEKLLVKLNNKIK